MPMLNFAPSLAMRAQILVLSSSLDRGEQRVGFLRVDDDVRRSHDLARLGIQPCVDEVLLLGIEQTLHDACRRLPVQVGNPLVADLQ